jgi:group I intron endonuclease
MGTLYIMTNKLDNKQYIGQTTGNFKHRLLNHKKKKSLIGNAIRKYGEFNFDILLLEDVPEEELDYWEEHYINECHSLVPNGYNIETGGQKHKHHNEDTRKKLSLSHKGQIPWMKGKHHTEEAKRKISENHKGLKNAFGHKVSKESRKKMSEAKAGNKHPFFGKHLSENHKRKISETERRTKNEIQSGSG